MKHLNIRVSGKVQGVFFRDSTRKEAEKLGIRGFVQNEPDGTVYIEAEATDSALAPFLEWLETGSPNARVEKVSTSEGEVKDFKGFEIRI